MEQKSEIDLYDRLPTPSRFGMSLPRSRHVHENGLRELSLSVSMFRFYAYLLVPSPRAYELIKHTLPMPIARDVKPP